MHGTIIESKSAAALDERHLAPWQGEIGGGIAVASTAGGSQRIERRRCSSGSVNGSSVSVSGSRCGGGGSDDAMQ